MVPGFTTLTCPPTPQLGQPHLPLRRPALAKSLGEDAEQVLRGSRGLVDHRPRGRQEQLAQRVEGREADGLVRVGDGGGVDSEDITVHHVPRAEAPAWLMRKHAEGFELDLKLWAGLWMIEHNPDGSPAG